LLNNSDAIPLVICKTEVTSLFHYCLKQIKLLVM
jgi:hypothetical protein